MKILGLYNNECALPLFDYLVSKGHEVVRASEIIIGLFNKRISL